MPVLCAELDMSQVAYAFFSFKYYNMNKVGVRVPENAESIS